MILVFGLVIICVAFLNNKPPDVYSSSICDGKYNLALIANRNKIANKMEFAEEILQMCRENAFQSVKLSYDLEEPEEICVEVYLTKKKFLEHKVYMTIDWVKNEDKYRNERIENLGTYYVRCRENEN